MKNMEERMREVELSLHNVKLLLREKVAQLKEQVSSKNSYSLEKILWTEKHCRHERVSM